VKTQAERDQIHEEFRATVEKMETLDSQLPKEYEMHGWVWLFLRK
jgi:hypothetical protein